MMENPRFELVIPAYNEAGSLERLVRAVVAAAEARGFTPGTFQLILVNNGSTDESERILAAIDSPWLRVVRVPVNRGYGNGIWAGLQATRAPWVGMTHADLQCDPADCFRALEMAGEDPRILVKGWRVGRDPGARRRTRAYEALASWILNLSVHEINAQPKVFSRDLISKMSSPPPGFTFDLYLVYTALKQGYRIERIDVDFPPRIAGQSKWSAGILRRYRTMIGAILYILGLAFAEGRLGKR